MAKYKTYLIRVSPEVAEIWGAEVQRVREAASRRGQTVGQAVLSAMQEFDISSLSPERLFAESGAASAIKSLSVPHGSEADWNGGCRKVKAGALLKNIPAGEAFIQIFRRISDKR